MAISARLSTTIIASNAKAADSGEGRGRISRLKEEGRRGLLLSAAISVAQVTDSRTELLKKYLQKTEENKAKNDKERLESYYKRNYRDYFGSIEGTLKQRKDELSESEKRILEWLEKNK